MIQTLSDALAERGYDTLTPVQEAVTNPDLKDSDLLVSAQTGSGKTVGFGLAIAPTLLDEAGMLGDASLPLALIVAPTRELAFQVKRELEWLYAKAGARVVSCVGGMDMRDERRALERGAHIVVGTPGRLVDHIQRGSFDMSALRAIVLDEADEMLDLGFREDLEFMLGEAPEDRRTLLFSATVPPMIATLAQHYQRDAVRVTTISERSQHADITYQALRVAQHDAENAIINMLRYHDAQNAIVFANTRATVNRLTARFSNRGFAVVCLSGELSQSERSHALQAMRDGRAKVCVATDVAARGIDLPNLELVIHAELPSNTEGLLHRSGRTGRAGRKGISALVVPPKLTKKAERLLKWAKVTAEWIEAPSAEEILRRDEERLLADPTWSEEITEDEAGFAARLLAEQSPETVAAAYLRLYRDRHSAPEELSSPDARPERPERKERAEFGPSRWVALSVGRDDRAEARWLLPLLCRGGGLDKDAIGAIRVQDSETFVELSEPVVDRFLGGLGEGGVLEEGVTVRPVEGTPEFASRPPRRDGPRPDGPRNDRPRKDGPRKPRPEGRGDGDAPARKRPDGEAWGAKGGSRGDKPKGDFKRDDRPRGDKPKFDKPRGDKPWGDKARGDRPKSDKPWGDKPRGDGGKDWKPKRDKDGGGKPTGKPGGKPFKPNRPGEGRDGPSKGFGGKPGARPARPAQGDKPKRPANAADTSQRFDPTGRASKGARPGKPRQGGMQPPKRGKS
ncbi:DEAD/DEAH box helicase [Salipiger bermudensis]|uniref:DEAD/DEAH box helicase n=1 Tax=Salipiger bermudensis TaxID=344736 RepID=UPI001C99CE81|nr:DEAD/DEAH box helicase [Salipiger bermudensis]MBY6004870.1 DEAD/DEAH box helicase [Salipiger bermudensis]